MCKPTGLFLNSLSFKANKKFYKIDTWVKDIHWSPEFSSSSNQFFSISVSGISGLIWNKGGGRCGSAVNDNDKRY